VLQHFSSDETTHDENKDNRTKSRKELHTDRQITQHFEASLLFDSLSRDTDIAAGKQLIE